jgi:hypothetical protein
MSTFTNLVRRASGKFMVDVVIAFTEGAAVPDTNVEGGYVGGTEIRHIEQGLLTYAAAAQGKSRGWMEQIDCDLVIDFYPEVDLSGDNVRFIVNGEEYVQKNTGRNVTDFFTRAGADTAFRTVALMRTGKIEGYIRYTDSTQTADLIHYDPIKKQVVWINTDPSPVGLADFSTAPVDGNLLEVSVAGVLALAVDPAKSIHALDIIAATTSTMSAAPLPRLEFYMGQSQIAALTATGGLYVRAFNQTTTMPVGRKDEWDFFAADGVTWLLGLRDAGLFGASVTQGF